MVDAITHLRDLRRQLDSALALADAQGEVLIAIHIAEALELTRGRLASLQDGPPDGNAA